jgi:hypothetical protein
MFENSRDAVGDGSSARPTSLPYPEEAPDPTLNETIETLLAKFFNRYAVPQEFWAFWRTVNIILDRTFANPAGMISQTKTLILRPEYANPGILAHEFSHLSYYLLSEDQKAGFAQDYVNIIQKDHLLRLLYFQKPHIKSSLVETHAEIFRYLGLQMPAGLKQYYPRLITLATPAA